MPPSPLSVKSPVAPPGINDLLYLEDFGTNLYTIDSMTGAASLAPAAAAGMASSAFARTPIVQVPHLQTLQWRAAIYLLSPEPVPHGLRRVPRCETRPPQGPLAAEVSSAVLAALLAPTDLRRQTATPSPLIRLTRHQRGGSRKSGVFQVNSASIEATRLVFSYRNIRAAGTGASNPQTPAIRKARRGPERKTACNCRRLPVPRF